MSIGSPETYFEAFRLQLQPANGRKATKVTMRGDPRGINEESGAEASCLYRASKAGSRPRQPDRVRARAAAERIFAERNTIRFHRRRSFPRNGILNSKHCPLNWDTVRRKRQKLKKYLRIGATRKAASPAPSFPDSRFDDSGRPRKSGTTRWGEAFLSGVELYLRQPSHPGTEGQARVREEHHMGSGDCLEPGAPRDCS